jgi:hypothetical protein
VSRQRTSTSQSTSLTYLHQPTRRKWHLRDRTARRRATHIAYLRGAATSITIGDDVPFNPHATPTRTLNGNVVTAHSTCNPLPLFPRTGECASVNATNTSNIPATRPTTHSGRAPAQSAAATTRHHVHARASSPNHSTPVSRTPHRQRRPHAHAKTQLRAGTGRRTATLCCHANNAGPSDTINSANAIATPTPLLRCQLDSHVRSARVETNTGDDVLSYEESPPTAPAAITPD